MEFYRLRSKCAAYFSTQNLKACSRPYFSLCEEKRVRYLFADDWLDCGWWRTDWNARNALSSSSCRVKELVQGTSRAQYSSDDMINQMRLPLCPRHSPATTYGSTSTQSFISAVWRRASNERFTIACFRIKQTQSEKLAGGVNVSSSIGVDHAVTPTLSWDPFSPFTYVCLTQVSYCDGDVIMTKYMLNVWRKRPQNEVRHLVSSLLDDVRIWRMNDLHPNIAT